MPDSPSRETGRDDVPVAGPTGDAPRPLTPEARRALAEAEERRQAARDAALPAETGGRKGPEPVRYGDWEKDGIISDF